MLKQNSCGIVCEYNPFHMGHKFQLDYLRERGIELIVCVMSGNFVQRGEPAIVDKWTRAKVAVNSGADLVVELPYVYAASSGENFALAAVRLLSMLGVSYISFGIEDDVALMYEFMRVSETEEFKARVSSYLNEGHSFASSWAFALVDCSNSRAELNSNMILALSYMNAVKSLGLSISPLPLRRMGAAYRAKNIDHELSSALAIRRELLSKLPDWNAVRKNLPESSYTELMGIQKYVCADDFSSILLSRIFSLREDGLRQIRGVVEGIENRILRAAKSNLSFEGTAAAVSTKRYGISTVKRMFTDIIFGVDRSYANVEIHNIDYIRVLAANSAGKKHLAQIKKMSDNKLINNLARDTKKFKPCERIMKFDIMATELYSLVYEYIDADEDYKRHPYLPEN